MTWTIVITVLATILVAAIAMNFATPEKTLEKKIEHRYAVTDPQFQREMGVMMGPAILPGNRITPLRNGTEIFPAMLQAIGSAQRTVTFETYIYWSGDVGKQFADALSERARAGVKVERYRPLHWYNIGRLNNRTHRKILVIDGRVGFTGGVGIADQWMGNAEDPDHWREEHFRIEGPAVAQLQAAFNDNWIKTTGEVLNGPDYFPPLEEVGQSPAHVFIASPASGSESMHLMYLLALAAAEETIDLAASYFVPDDLIMEAIIAARHRGVRVRLLLPGKHIDSETVRLASKAEWGELLLAGVEIYEYQPTMIHVKLLVIDGEMVSVGSTNFDIRSFRLNDEASLNIYDREFAARMTDVFESDLKHTKEYTYDLWQARPWKDKFAEKFILPIKSQL